MDDRLYVVGGFNGKGVIANSECYKEETDNWYEC